MSEWGLKFAWIFRIQVKILLMTNISANYLSVFFSSNSQYFKHFETFERLKWVLVCTVHITEQESAWDTTKTDQTSVTHQSEASCESVVVNPVPPSLYRMADHYRPPLECVGVCVCDPLAHLCDVSALPPLCLQTVWPFTTIIVTLIFFCCAVLQGKHVVSLRKKFPSLL